MFFDIGWSEMGIVLLVALIIIGPRDLPKVARTMGRWVGKARAMARDFQRSLEDMAREAELDEIRKGIEKVGSTDLRSAVSKTIDPKGELEKAFEFKEGSEAAPPAGESARPQLAGAEDPPSGDDPVAGVSAAAEAPSRVEKG